MKKTARKLISIVMAMIILSSFAVIDAGAYRIGDVINYAQPTDIVASINGYQMMSYNVDGLTYIVAEDLRHYGIDVVYDNSTRSLSLERNSSVTSIAPHVTNPDFWKIGSNKVRKNILYTDIVTYVSSEYVGSYNIDGATIIRFDELSRFGQVSYDNNRREISLYIDDIEYNTIASFVDLCYNEGIVSENAAELDRAIKVDYGYQASCDMFLRAKGNVLVFEYYIKGVEFNYYDKLEMQQVINGQEYEIKATYQEVKESVPELSAVAFVFYGQSNEEMASTTIYL